MSRLVPASLADSLISLPAQAIYERYTGTLFLLIELPGDDDRMLAPLIERFGDLDPMESGIETGVQPTVEMTLLNAEREREDRVGPDAMEHLARLATVAHFAFPLWRHRAATEGLTLGRTSENQLVLAEPSVSARHARFEWDPQGTLAIRDLGSKNGTHVNGQRATEHQPTWLQPMDQLHFGNVKSFVCTASVLRGALRTF